jgi:hypothetical protein
MIILDYFLLNEPQFSTALYTGLFLLLSAIIGIALRRLWVEGTVWGFMVLAGSADLAIFISRALELPTSIFGPLVVAICAVIIFVLRSMFLTAMIIREPTSKVYIAVIAAFFVVIWAGNILHPLPDSGFSSHHGVVPLYIQESFSLGRFLTIEDTAFGKGLVTSLFYPADLLGLVALSGWFGASEVYPAFNAGSITATLLMFALLSRTLRNMPVALAAFFLLAMVMFGFDPFFRTVLGGNWGDVLMYLGGALVCYYLSQGDRIDRAFLLAAVASTFLVFARHYGAFYSALIVTFCFIISWGFLRERSFRPWLVVGALWTAFSARELYYLFGKFSEYYPGSWQVDRVPRSFESLALGALTDWGLIDGSDFGLGGLSVRGLYIVILLLVLLRIWRRGERTLPQFTAIISPVVVLLAPLGLQILTGYRTHPDFSKLYILGIFFFSWYPAFLLTHLISNKTEILTKAKIILPAMAAMTVFAGMIIVKKVEPQRFIGSGLKETLEKLFEDKIVDREVVKSLHNELSPAEMQAVIDRPVLYLYFEPGASLRLYLGGEFTNDLDFWSDPVKEKIKDAPSFKALIAALGYPNIYVGLMANGVVPNFGFSGRKRFFSEIENADTAPWINKIIQYGNARFFIVQEPGT